VFLWLVRLVISYQSTIGERYSQEIARLDSELQEARTDNAKLRARIEALEDGQGELRYLRRIVTQHGIYNPWAPPGLEEVTEGD
jgi:cell division protein FtsB